MTPSATRKPFLSSAFALALAGSASAQLTWTELQPAQSPPARHGQAMSFAIPSYQPMLFGGTDGNSTFGDTWSWNGQTWTLRASTGPSPRHGHVLGRLDFRDDSLLLFGGRDAAGALNGETWVWNGAAWSQWTTAVAPSARTGHAIAVDEMVLRTLYLFGGRTAAGLSAETWKFEDDRWSLVPTQHAPPAREGHAMVWSAFTGGILLQGGRDGSTVLADEWRFDGTDWQELTVVDAVPRADHSLLLESMYRHRYLTFGGRDGAASADTAERTMKDKWLHHQTVGVPSARTEASLEEGNVGSLLFGGRDANGAALGDTWLMQPSTLPIVESFGTGCGPGPWGPTGPFIFVSPFKPLLGNPLQGNVLSATPNPFVLLVIGSEHPSPPIGTCGLLVQRKRVRVLPATFLSPGLSSYDFGFDIPFDVNLRGTTLCLQAIERDPSTGGLAFSEGVRLTLAD